MLAVSVGSAGTWLMLFPLLSILVPVCIKCIPVGLIKLSLCLQVSTREQLVLMKFGRCYAIKGHTELLVFF
jgi:hypothetical protein